jgi:hypothetical protein
VDEIVGWVLGLIFFGFLGFLTYEMVQTMRELDAHQKFLETHGCQLIHSSPTGRDLGNVKIHHYEYVYVYECADGTRTELK